MSEFIEVKKLVQNVVKFKKNKEYEKAMKTLLEALEDYPENNFLKTSLADLYIRMNRLEGAEKLADQVLKSDYQNHNALTVKGNVALQKRDYEEALQFFKQAYQRKETDYLASRLIRTYMYLDELELALSVCQQKLEGDSINNRFKKIEAEIYKKMNKLDKAADTMEDYLSEEKDDQFAFREKIELKLKRKSPDLAVRELKQLLRVDKYRKNIYLQTLLAEKLQDLKRYEKAVEVYKEAIILDPGNIYIIKNLGMSLYRDKKLEEALPYLEEAFQDDPNDYYIRSTLEYIYKSLSMHQQGIEYFQKIIKETGLKNLWGIIKKLVKEGDANG